MSHEHSVIDTDTHFLIDENTRMVNSTNAAIPKIMQFDHNSERLTFRLSKEVDGHDMNLCNAYRIEYINIDKKTRSENKDKYVIDDVAVSKENPEEITFSWLISDKATQYEGLLSFVVVFMCINDEGKVDYRWATEPYKGLSVGEGMNNSEEIAREYSDILEQWYANILDIIAKGGIAGGVTETMMTEAFADHNEDEAAHADIRETINALNNSSPARIANVVLNASKWNGSGNLYSQIVTIEGVTEASQVDLTPSVEQLVVFYEKDLTLVTENEDGVVVVYAIGQKPVNDYVIQATITEVNIDE